ncbi:hypothetical protein [Microseira sp. BLCC-F43]
MTRRETGFRPRNPVSLGKVAWVRSLISAICDPNNIMSSSNGCVTANS